MSPQTHAGLDYSKVDEILANYGYEKSNLIAILQKVQEVFRYLPLDVMTYIGTKIEGLSPATVYGVATFYAQFSLEPKGKYEIKVCDGTACHVRGSMPVLNAVYQCLNPVVVVNGKVYPQMTADAIKIVIATIMNEEEGK